MACGDVADEPVNFAGGKGEIPLGIAAFGLKIAAKGLVVTNYFNYGCWCGSGGGGPALDDTDRCCYQHDKAYERVDKLHDVAERLFQGTRPNPLSSVDICYGIDSSSCTLPGYLSPTTCDELVDRSRAPATGITSEAFVACARYLCCIADEQAATCFKQRQRSWQLNYLLSPPLRHKLCYQANPSQQT